MRRQDATDTRKNAAARCHRYDGSEAMAMVRRAFGLRFRFSLASLMIAMTLAAFGSLWLREYAFRPQREAELLEQLTTKHATGIAISYQTGDADEPSYGPVWWFTRQTPVVDLFVQEDVRDMSPKLFSTFTELRQAVIKGTMPPPKRASSPASTIVHAASYAELQAGESVLTPPQWDDLLSHPRLVSLEIYHQELTPAQLETLANNRSIRHLGIRNARLDNADVAVLGRMHQLESLELCHQQLDGTTLVDALPRFKSLHRLALVHCPLDDKVLPAIAKLPALRELHLSHTTVTDAGIRHLVNSQSLTELLLNDTFVSYKASDDLASIPSLKVLHLVEAGFDQRQLQALSARAPHLTIRCLQVPVWPNLGGSIGSIGAASSATPASPTPPLVRLAPAPVPNGGVDDAPPWAIER
jgi:hypothetical protein